MYCIQVLVLLSRLLPIAAELLLRRSLPTAWLADTRCQAGLLAAAVIMNRFAVAAAHCGYYACCSRLAQYGDSGGVYSSLLSVFLREYRHPLRAMRRQLRWDALRILIYAAVLFPPLLTAAIGAHAANAWQQLLFAGGSALLLILGAITAFLYLQRFVPSVYLTERYPSLCAALAAACGASHDKAAVWRSALQRAALLPLRLLPFSLLPAAADIGCTAAFLKTRRADRRQCRLARTRVLNP